MGFSTLGMTLGVINGFEKNQIELYKNLSQISENEGARLVLIYLGKRDSYIPQAMNYYTEYDKEIILHTPIFEEENVVSDLKLFAKNKTLLKDANANEVLDYAMEFILILIKSYNRIAEQRISDKVKAFIKTLYTVTVRDLKELKKIKAVNYF